MKRDARIRELVAVGASVTANCQPCLQYHVGKAREAGADEAEVSEAIQVARMVRKGAASKMDQLISEIAPAARAGGGTRDEGCGGGS